MRKIVSFIIALMMCLSLCSCGGKNENTSTDKDNITSTIEKNTSVLSTEESDNFDTEYAAMIERVEALNADTALIAGTVYETWSNAGPSDFYTFYGSIFSITDGTTLDTVRIVTLGAVACAVLPGKYWDDNAKSSANLANAVEVLEKDSAKAQEVLDAAIAYNHLYDSLKTADEALSADMKVFKEQYKDQYEEEVDTLREWILESSMYVDHALNPSGSLIEYGNAITEYEQNLNRFSKIANSY